MLAKQEDRGTRKFFNFKGASGKVNDERKALQRRAQAEWRTEEERERRERPIRQRVEHLVKVLNKLQARYGAIQQTLDDIAVVFVVERSKSEPTELLVVRRPGAGKMLVRRAEAQNPLLGFVSGWKKRVELVTNWGPVIKFKTPNLSTNKLESIASAGEVNSIIKNIYKGPKAGGTIDIFSSEKRVSKIIKRLHAEARAIKILKDAVYKEAVELSQKLSGAEAEAAPAEEPEMQ